MITWIRSTISAWLFGYRIAKAAWRLQDVLEDQERERRLDVERGEEIAKVCVLSPSDAAEVVTRWRDSSGERPSVAAVVEAARLCAALGYSATTEIVLATLSRKRSGTES